MAPPRRPGGCTPGTDVFDSSRRGVFRRPTCIGSDNSIYYFRQFQLFLFPPARDSLSGSPGGQVEPCRYCLTFCRFRMCPN